MIINNFINQIPLYHYIFKNISKRISIVSKKSILFFFKENLKNVVDIEMNKLKKLKKKKKQPNQISRLIPTFLKIPGTLLLKN